MHDQDSIFCNKVGNVEKRADAFFLRVEQWKGKKGPRATRTRAVKGLEVVCELCKVAVVYVSESLEDVCA